MPDISMCTNDNCPKRLDCYRYMTIPSEFWQSYGSFRWIENRGCDYFWPLNPGSSNGRKAAFEAVNVCSTQTPGTIPKGEGYGSYEQEQSLRS